MFFIALFKPDEDEKMTTKAMKVPEFCAAHQISRGTFYNWLRDGTGPKILKVGGSTRITPEAVAEWRARSTRTRTTHRQHNAA